MIASAGQGAATRGAESRQARESRSLPPRGFRNPLRVMVTLGLVGLLITASSAWTAHRIDRNNEHRLLEVQTKQAAEVVSSAIVGIDNPLQTALDIASATGGNAQQFTRFMATYVAQNGLFVSASLWQTTGASMSRIASAGQPAALVAGSTAAKAVFAHAISSSTFTVTSVSIGGSQRIGYTLADPKTSTYVVYAERAVPANRRASVESNAAFAELNYATYLGATTDLSALETTDVALSRLPLSGDIDRVAIPFGDTTLTLVTSPTGHLGGAFEAELPWMLLIVGILLTFGAASLAGRLVRRRVLAEDDAHTIGQLYEQLDSLYGEQRTISETLQHALLPQSNPAIPSLEIASLYVAGARGVDVGGDWYSIIRLDDTHFGFVVGDVSGRGVEAAAIMARIRFTLRAYLFEGHPPGVALELCSRQLDIETDGHFATVLVGLGDLATRAITLANAGHLNPLMVSASGTRFVETIVEPPLGVAVSKFRPTTVVMEPASMLIAFTDGLVERRGEDLDLGLARLAAAVTTTDVPLDNLLTNVLAAMTGDATEDDVAILAFRWRS